MYEFVSQEIIISDVFMTHTTFANTSYNIANDRGVTLDSLRKTIGVVPQDCVLFNDTVGYNIKYGNPNATEVC